MESQIALALPSAIATVQMLTPPQDSHSHDLTDIDVMRAWEADFTLFSHSTLLAEAIAQDTLHISAPLATIHDRLSTPTPPTLQTRSELLQSMHNIQKRIQSLLDQCVAKMTVKPRLYRLAERLPLSPQEIRAFIFIILTCTGMDGPPADERRQTPRPRSELFTCRQFANMNGSQLLHFLSPSRKHFSQGLLEVDEEFAAMYTENRFRAPREVLKAIYGCTLTIDEAMTLGTSDLAAILKEEPGSLYTPDVPASSPTSDQNQSASNGPHIIDDSESPFPSSSPVKNSFARNRTTDNSEVLELLSELRLESELSNMSKHSSQNDQLAPTESSSPDQNPDSNSNDNEKDIDALGYEDDMDYLKDGFDVVKEACKVYNFRDKNSEEDRYTNTKRPVEALQREAVAKLRNAKARFSRRLNKTNSIAAFTPRLELLVTKLKLDHFERMVILTLVGGVLSQSIRKTLRSDPSQAYESGITVSKLLRVHCDGDLKKEIDSRCFFYRNSNLVRSGIITIDVPYNMPYSDLGDSCCELDHMVLDYVAGLHTELNEIMDSARCYRPNIHMDSVILPKNMKDLVLQSAENFDVFRRLRKEIGFDDIVRYGKGLTLFFHGKSGTGKTLFANALASHLNKKLLVVDFNSLNNSKHSNSDAYRIVFREAKIHGAIVFMDECDELFESRDRGGKGTVAIALREMETFDGIMILATNRPHMLDEAMHRRIALSLMFEPPDAKHRLAIWEKHIPKDLRLDTDVDLKALAIEFELTGGFIKNAVFQALAQAVNRVQRSRRDSSTNGGANMKEPPPLQANDVVITMKELRQACRLQARGDLKRSKLERRVLPVSGLDKLVASKTAMKTLQDIVDVEKVRAVLATRWGFKDRQARSNCVLIMGPSGCGKSFAAGCLGFEIGRPLQRIAASELHGSREGMSQIGDVFSQAAVAGAVVVVEDAEQLLYETSQANLQASPGSELLFHMQSFDGLVILCCTTTNGSTEAGWPQFVPIPSVVSSLLSYIVMLTVPGKADRVRLWKQLIPEETPVNQDLLKELGTIAEKYEFTGKRIASCVRRAAAVAAMRRNRAALIDMKEPISEEDGVQLDDLKDACEAEHKLKTEAEGSAAWMSGLII